MDNLQEKANSPQPKEYRPRQGAEPNGNAGLQSMTSQAYSILRTDIISGKLEPGRKLKLEELRKQYKLGSSPIREALSRLSSDQLVERIDQRGFRVAVVSAEDFNELLKTRCWVEERALRESIANGDGAWEDQVVLATFHLTRTPHSQPRDAAIGGAEWDRRHKHFHMTILSACGSSLLLQFCSKLYDHNIRYRQLAGITAHSQRDINHEHQAITDAILAHDADLATELLISHYELTGKLLAESMATYFDASLSTTVDRPRKS